MYHNVHMKIIYLYNLVKVELLLYKVYLYILFEDSIVCIFYLHYY